MGCGEANDPALRPAHLRAVNRLMYSLRVNYLREIQLAHLASFARAKSSPQASSTTATGTEFPKVRQSFQVQTTSFSGVTSMM